MLFAFSRCTDCQFIFLSRIAEIFYLIFYFVAYNYSRNTYVVFVKFVLSLMEQEVRFGVIGPIENRSERWLHNYECNAEFLALLY